MRKYDGTLAHYNKLYAEMDRVKKALSKWNNTNADKGRLMGIIEQLEDELGAAPLAGGRRKRSTRKRSTRKRSTCKRRSLRA